MYGILGINARNFKYIRASRKTRRILDSKLLTKKYLLKGGIPVLDTIAIIKTRKELLNFNWEALPDSFAIKPNRGFGGGGILVVYARKRKFKEKFEKPPLVWIKADKSQVTKEDLESHIFDILEGNFSLFYLPDVAFFEERAKVISELKPYSWRGIPDIRVIVYEGIPVMAMLRLPTEESKGRANLHDGAIGVGVDLATGRTLSAIHHRNFIDYYPGTRHLLRGIKIPHFKKVLLIASQVQKIFKAKFLGVDITIDREKGPVVLEVNLRPGLEIQIANLAGLEDRLKRVRGLSIKNEEKMVRIAREIFSEEEYEEEEVLGRKVLGIIEEVEIPYKEIQKGKEIERRLKKKAKVDTGAFRTTISYDLARKVGIDIIEDIIEERRVRSALGEEIRSVVPFVFYLKGEKIETEVFLADRSQMKYEMIIGRRDLKKFIIDPSKIK